MKKYLNKVLKNKIMLVILVLTLVAFPAALVRPAQGEVTTIVIGLGIDKKDDKYNISIQYADESLKIQEVSKLNVISDSGSTIAQCFSNLKIKTGKEIGFEHCNLIVLSDSVTSENVKSVLDTLYRKANISLNAFLLSTDVSAKDILLKAAELETSSSSSLQNNLGFNKEKYSASGLTTLADFFSDFYSKSEFSKMAFIKSEEPDENQTETKPDKKIKNEGQTSIFKAGKKVALVEKDITKGINWLNETKLVGTIVANNVTDNKYYNDATVALYMSSSKVKVTPRIERDILILDVKIKAYVEVVEVLQENNSIDLNMGYKSYLSDELKKKASTVIKNDINNATEFAKTNFVDVCKFQERFYKYRNAEYKDWIKSHTSEDIYKFAKVNVDVDIYYYK